MTCSMQWIPGQRLEFNYKKGHRVHPRQRFLTTSLKSLLSCMVPPRDLGHSRVDRITVWPHQIPFGLCESPPLEWAGDGYALTAVEVHAPQPADLCPQYAKPSSLGGLSQVRSTRLARERKKFDRRAP